MSRQARLISALIIVAAVIVCHPTAVPGQAGDQKIPLSGTISGRVTVGGKAAANISVVAYSLETMNARSDPAKTVTDTDGRYRLSGLPLSQYQILALAPELTTGDEDQESNFGFIFARGSKSVTLAAGEVVENVDLKLVRGGVITGRVTDATNKPVVEEFIMLLPVDQNGNQLRNPRMPFRSEPYQTDDRGIYRIYGLPAGRYKVSVGLESGGGMNFARGFYARTFYPDTPDQTKARVVELAEGTEATGIDIQVGSQEKTYVATGRVVDAETGQPLAGVRLSYLIATKSPGRYSSSYVPYPTGARGSFQMMGLSPGHYGAYVASEYEGGDYYSDVTYFDVVDKDVSGVEVKAIRGLTLSGFVVAEGDAQGGVPPKIERLRIYASAMQAPDAQQRNGGESPVAPDGSFRIGGLRAGRFSIYLYPMGPSSGRPTISRIERDGIAVTQGVELQAGQSASDLRILINYGKGTIRGAITFVGGALPPDARVVIRCSREGKQDTGGTYMDSRGRYLINGLAAGTYEVTLQIIRNTNVPGLPPIPPQKQFVQVSNESESEANFVVDLTPKERP
jgi:hypothetical protein